MRKNSKKLLLTICVLLVIFATQTIFVYGQTVTDTPTPTPDNSSQVSALNNKIHELEGKISDLQSQEQSLASQIDVMDSQIKITEYRIDATKQQMVTLTDDIGVASTRIQNLESSLDNVTKILRNRIVATYKAGGVQPVQFFLSSTDAENFIDRANYLRIVQEHDKRLLYDTQQARNDYANQKNILEEKRQQVAALQTQLEDYNKQLDQQKQTKQKLLADTQGSEANYEKLLAAARAQLAGFSKFVASQGGASILSNQTVCDDWGCYYNQRDSQWGNVALNNTNYSIASDGCLVTSMAMVYTHFGHRSVTPLTINSIPNNFASYEPAWLLKTIVADGTSSTRTSASIDSELSSGRPVIVGISYDGGPYPDHFVVLISGSSGSYQMNDPFTPNGHNIPFTSHYSVGSIREIDRIQM